MIIFASVIFTSAFLLFQVQPIIARYILPWYGGGPGVWTVCMLFFQTFLLSGYTYAHLLASRVKLKRQVWIHTLLLCITLLFIPITPSGILQPDGTGDPTLGILKLLLLTIGVPYLLVSSTGPLMQHWFSRSHPRRSPYRLYALSNLGSLLALLTYPFLFEPMLRLKQQTWFWSGGYILFVFLTILCAFHLFRVSKTVGSTTAPSVKPRRTARTTHRILWVLLAACGSVVLLAVTNQMTQDVAAVPFLWILPLSLYLISFIICFDGEQRYRRIVFLPLLVLGVSLSLYVLNHEYTRMSLQIPSYALSVFACCMICHGELARIKPDAGSLTEFYLFVALGGALGGMFVSLLAPVIFNGFWELPIGYVMTCILAGVSLLLTRGNHPRARFVPWDTLGKIGLTPERIVSRIILPVGGAGTIVLILFFVNFILTDREDSIYSERNFYGVLTVDEQIAQLGQSAGPDGQDGKETRKRVLHHGRINHGCQLLGEEMSRWPTTYFSPNTGAGIALMHHPARHFHISRKTGHAEPARGLHVGIIGLGTGTLAAYIGENDTFRFYEINPAIREIARTHFRYLEEAEGEYGIIPGDGRLSLEREFKENGSHNFDVLVIDAFSGDAIPVHLLTEEAMQLYWQHLREDGLLAVHITNRHVDLRSVVRVLAHHFGKEAVLISSEGSSQTATRDSDWILVTAGKRFLGDDRLKELSSEWRLEKPEPIHWTDDYSNLARVLR